MWLLQHVLVDQTFMLFEMLGIIKNVYTDQTSLLVSMQILIQHLRCLLYSKC